MAVTDAGQASTTEDLGADRAAGAPAGGEDGRRWGVELERCRGNAVGQGRAGRVPNAKLAGPRR